MEETPVESLPDLFKDLRRAFNSGKTKSIAWRKQQIEQLYRMCDEQQEYFAAAARIDFHRPTAETLLYDCGVVSFLIVIIMTFQFGFFSTRFEMNVIMFSITSTNGHKMKNVRMHWLLQLWINTFIQNRLEFV